MKWKVETEIILQSESDFIADVPQFVRYKNNVSCNPIHHTRYIRLKARDEYGLEQDFMAIFTTNGGNYDILWLILLLYAYFGITKSIQI